MSRFGEIWFFKDSPAAAVARLLGRQYSLRLAEPPRRGRPLAEPIGPAIWLCDPAKESVTPLLRLARGNSQLRLIAIVGTRDAGIAERPEWFACLPRSARPAVIRRAIEAALENIALAASERAAREGLERAEREREDLNRIGVALSATHDVAALLEMILTKTREITGADAGSLYILESSATNGSALNSLRRLRFQLTQNDSIDFSFKEYTIPVDEDSVTGYTALHGVTVALDDAYNVPSGLPYRFNTRYDNETGYKTRSLLTLPMKNARGEVLGVVQLLNCKRRPTARLATVDDLDREVQPFPAHSVRLAESLASQAAVAYENSRLYQDIESLFEGFVQAAVTAIEQRDPTTSGHSLRVSRMTVGLAEIVDRADNGQYRGLHFSADQMKEIRYAALLHDFGKVGVREEVLVKAKKLYPAQFDVVQMRFDYVRKEMEARCEHEKFLAMRDLPREEGLRRVERLDQDFCRRSTELDEAFAVIAESNEPTVLTSSQFERLFEVARRTFLDPRGAERPLLTNQETRFLSIPRGSLDPQERQQIESHVVHSFNFLMQIPWTRTIHGIPEIVRAHHEKMNGTGYPYKLRGEQIPVQARMMTICDIFDALSASDRPYKKAVPPERALAILEDSVAGQELDSELFHLFLQGRVYDLVHAPA